MSFLLKNLLYHKKAHIKLRLEKTKLIIGAHVDYLKNNLIVMVPIDKEGKFKSLKYLATESKEMFFCDCKMTNNQPLCDGSHSKP